MKQYKDYYKIALLNAELDYVFEKTNDTIDALKSLYNMGIVYSKYRNIVAVSSFYEYLLSGRCDSLQGANGAYNLYESEARTNTIISQLNNISEALETITAQQNFISTQIRETNDSLFSIKGQLLYNNDLNTIQIEKLDNINTNTQIGAYYAEKNAVLTNALGYLIAIK